MVCCSESPLCRGGSTVLQYIGILHGESWKWTLLAHCHNAGGRGQWYPLAKYHIRGVHGCQCVMESLGTLLPHLMVQWAVVSCSMLPYYREVCSCILLYNVTPQEGNG